MHASLPLSVPSFSPINLTLVGHARNAHVSHEKPLVYMARVEIVMRETQRDNINGFNHMICAIRWWGAHVLMCEM